MWRVSTVIEFDSFNVSSRRGAHVQRVRPVVPLAAAARGPSAEKATFRLQRVRQPVPVADVAGAPQGGVPALERLVVLRALRLGALRQRRLPRGPPPAAIMPPPHCCREARPAGHFRLNLVLGGKSCKFHINVAFDLYF